MDHSVELYHTVSQKINPIFSFSDSMELPIRWIECKAGESTEIVRKLLGTNVDAKLLNLYELCSRFDGDMRKLLNELMFDVKSGKSGDLILWNPHMWMELEEDPPGNQRSMATDDHDSDSEDEGNPSMRPASTSLLYAIMNWLRVFRGDSPMRLVIVSDFPPARKLKELGIEVVVDFFQKLRSADVRSATQLLVSGHNITGKKCVCIQGHAGSGKSQALRRLSESVDSKVVWLRTHEIINCELGETGRIIRDLFLRASGYRPSLVLMDDADLCLNTSGKIVKECIEEISICVSEMDVMFVFATAVDIDPAIMRKVDQIIHLS